MTDAEGFRHIAPAFHEVDMFLWFADYGLSPYWALGSLCINEFDGFHETDMELSDGVWHVRLNYNPDTGIAPRASDPVNGEKLYEYNLHADGPGEKKASFNISPRFDDMRKPDGESLSVPWCGGEGLDIHTQGSNLSYDEYIYILQRVLQQLADDVGADFNRRYFSRPLPESNIVTTELYVRILRDMSKKLVRNSGVFYRIMHLLAGEKGTKWVYSADNEDIVGKRHAFDLEPAAASELGPDHSLGKRLKCYHPKHVRENESRDDPLSSPKYGVAFHRSLNDAGAIQWQNREEMLRELEETLINTLRWAGIPIDPELTTYVEDDHFSIQPSEREIARLSDPTPELEAKQGHLLVRVLDDLSPSADSLLRDIATDGGKHVNEIADDTGYSISQIYRAIDEVGEIVVNDNGLVRLFSEKIRQEIQAIAEHIEDEVISAANRVAKLCGVETRSAADSALQRWMDKYGVEFLDVSNDDRDGRLRIDTVLSVLRSSTKPTLAEVLQEGFDAWTDAGRDPRLFLNLEWTAREVWDGDDSGLVRATLR